MLLLLYDRQVLSLQQQHQTQTTEDRAAENRDVRKVVRCIIDGLLASHAYHGAPT